MKHVLPTPCCLHTRLSIVTSKIEKTWIAYRADNLESMLASGVNWEYRGPINGRWRSRFSRWRWLAKLKWELLRWQEHRRLPRARVVVRR